MTDANQPRSTPSSLGHLPAEPRWSFDQGVTDVFEDMLRRSIPQYDVMRSLVTALTLYYAVPGTRVLDIGASRGDAIAALVASERGRDFAFDAMEVSEPMLTVLRERFRGNRNVRVVPHDLRRPFRSERNVSVALSVLTLQFTPIEHRMRILANVRHALMDDGVFILVEKLLGSSAEIDEMLVGQYHSMKLRAGYSVEEIDRKAESLEGVLVPVTARWNEELLDAAGFTRVECVWRFLNFAAWVAR